MLVKFSITSEKSVVHTRVFLEHLWKRAGFESDYCGGRALLVNSPNTK